MWRCAQPGQDLYHRLGKKLGNAKAHTTKAVSRIEIVFQREKYIMDLIAADRCRDQLDAPSSFTGSPLARTSATIERI